MSRIRREATGATGQESFLLSNLSNGVINVIRYFMRNSLPLSKEQNDERKMELRDTYPQMLRYAHLIAVGHKDTENLVTVIVRLYKRAEPQEEFENNSYFFPLLKLTPKRYSLISNYKNVYLPRRIDVRDALEAIPFFTGINKHILKCLMRQTNKTFLNTKFCTVMFDDMPIDPSLHYYNLDEDYIQGFEDHGTNYARRPKIADRVLVFMACGMYDKWKQPLAYYFHEGRMKPGLLAHKIKQAVISCKKIGLKPKSIICDQKSTNIAAINELYSDTREHFMRQGIENNLFGVLIDKEEIIPLYDPPRLLKGIRNNFYNYNVQFKWNRNGKDDVDLANWDHIKQMYSIDQENPALRYCVKLTSDHINNKNKEKVSLAAEVLSHTVASVLNIFSSDRIPEEAQSTARFVYFMDSVFDSVNGGHMEKTDEKYLRCAVTDKSQHKAFWAEAIEVFESMKFLKSHKISPTVNCWIHTLKGFCYLWDLLKTENNIDSGRQILIPRYFNLEPLDNFLEEIRSCELQNVKPNAASFVDSFKTLIVSPYYTHDDNTFNCENIGFIILDDLSKIPKNRYYERKEFSNIPKIPIPNYKYDNSSLLSRGKYTIAAELVAQLTLATIKCCKHCVQDLLGDVQSRLIYFTAKKIGREFIPKAASHALLVPSTNFNKLFQKCIFVLSKVLPQVCTHRKLIHHLMKMLRPSCRNKRFSCKKHNLNAVVLRCTINYYIRIWINNINNILKGKRTVIKSSDKIKEYARRKFLDRQKHLKKIRVMKNN